MAAHTDGPELCALSHTIHPTSRKEPKNIILDLGGSPTVSAPRVTETWYQDHLPTVPQSS